MEVNSWTNPAIRIAVNAILLTPNTERPESTRPTTETDKKTAQPNKLDRHQRRLVRARSQQIHDANAFASGRLPSMRINLVRVFE